MWEPDNLEVTSLRTLKESGGPGGEHKLLFSNLDPRLYDAPKPIGTA